ncbi:hypothetical protein BaRGS_00006144 [Batillaria attramentaria]|uniref:Uncharacterized protein n=1 Tax=Batillaria attramentaria TaxID=370345 RepID=A0ABD0LU80_9CAEN
MKDPLDEELKREMLTSYLKELHLGKAEQDALVTEILLKDVSGAAFPWCCRRLVQNWRARGAVSANFTFPAAAYESLLQRMLRHPVHGETVAAVMALTMLGLGQFLHNTDKVQPHLETLGFRHFSAHRLNEYADILKGSVLNETRADFHSRVIYDAVGLALGRSSSMSILLKVCDVKFLVQHVQTKESEDEVNIPIGPSTDDGQLLMQVICNYVANGQLMEICQHPILQDPMFLQEFVRFCNSNKNYLQKFLSATDTVHNMKLLYWSIWGLGLCFTNWCLATMRDVKADENALLNSLLKAVCVCLLSREQSGHGEPRALTEADNQEGTGIKMLLQKLSTAPSLSVGSFIDIPIPEEKQCFTAEAKAKRARLISNAWEGRHCYLGNSFLPIPNTLINVHMSDDGDKLRVMVPSKQWYLVLRLLADREVDERDEKGNTVLHLAAEAGEQEAILLAVRSGAPPPSQTTRVKLRWTSPRTRTPRNK